MNAPSGLARDIAPDFAQLRAAAARIAGHAHRTPVFSGRSLDAIVGARLLLKCENLQRTGAEAVPPFDDARVIAGQGTAAMELIEDHRELDALIAPVGGGGLLAGTIIAATAMAPGIAVYGAEPAAARDTFDSVRAGTRQPLRTTPDTIADGLRTSVGEITFPVIRDGVSAILTAREDSIVRAMRLIWERLKLVVEPSGAVPIAALLDNPQALAGKRVGVIVSGGNLDLDRLPWYRTRGDDDGGGGA